jgi:GAF domain-containing protein
MPSESERLHLLYEVNRRLATIRDLPELIAFATARARELFGAEGCTLLLADESRGEFYFHTSAGRPQVAERLAEVRFPIDRGIAGWVLARGEAVRVEDARNDPRFYSGVDQLTGIVTRTLMCAPLRTAWGTIGVIEVVNAPLEAATREDLVFLEALAGDIAVAHEKVALAERLRGEVIGLRQASRFVGLALIGLGIVLVGGALVVQLAWALPWRDLPSRTGLWFGVLMTAVGATLAAVGRGRLIRATPAPRL